ncbi:hypothetical protein [Streptomyces sp. Wh19]|uniref:hypothetical protein n=1 Tax=Streptomyces sp. Wh19 TaxID=3076629 RepID=UPI0029588460|nr:hypothetical protein [Streptomyces sp. Wh19]MDV9194396.1 hypothetical protein [Streptomyces sp. Wh19]
MDLPELARLATSGRSTSSGGAAGQSSCEITLFTSSRDGIVALVDGNNWRWAHTTLDTAGFERSSDGNRAIPLTDLDRTREVLLTLGVVARITRTEITPSSETYIGDFARDLVDQLPGQWSVGVESYAMRVWQGDLAACMWSPSMAATLEQRRVRWAAVLRRDDGAELAIIRDPQYDLYHVGALHPVILHPDGLVTPPASVTVQPTPASAASQINSRLLPAYTRAVLHCQVNSLEEDLDRARQTYASGAAPEPAPKDLTDAYVRFTTTAPQVTAAVRVLAAPSEHEAAVLQRVEDVIAAGARAGAETAVAPRTGQVAWWLAEGGVSLIDLARRSVPNSEPPATETGQTIVSACVLPPAPARSASSPRR